MTETPAFLAEPALAALLDLLPEARVVGGAVRDTLVGHALVDVDLASPLAPETVMHRLAAAGVKVIATGLSHGTVTAVLPKRSIEITTLRRDVETDGRHAVVAFTDDWREDAARRDFTINAMSMTRDGTVFDYFGGKDDLRAGRVRFVGDPALRIQRLGHVGIRERFVGVNFLVGEEDVDAVPRPSPASSRNWSRSPSR